MTLREDIAGRSSNGRASVRPLAASFNGVPVPIYAQLVTLFRRRIESGEWVLHQQMPTLESLVEELGVARATIRHAIGFLEREGLIGRYRGRGTFVLAQPESEVWHEIPTDWDTLIQPDRDRAIKVEWLVCKQAENLPVPSHSGGTLAPAYQYTRRVFRRGGVPYFTGHSYIERRAFQAIGKSGFGDTAPLRSLQSHFKKSIGRAMQTINVGSADMETARLLDVPLNAPVVVLHRSVFDRNEMLIYESEGFHRGDFVRIRMQLR
ncbi:MAG TPA: GntR family transcriptional regulator [Stellaceae bacterium]|jgi:GntR family transcriptional regulator|nr:GntR family transcriptional regulator [Stellaceae bacterium]